jgi:hypothetical protein
MQIDFTVAHLVAVGGCTSYQENYVVVVTSPWSNSEKNNKNEKGFTTNFIGLGSKWLPYVNLRRRENQMGRF